MYLDQSETDFDQVPERSGSFGAFQNYQQLMNMTTNQEAAEHKSFIATNRASKAV